MKKVKVRYWITEEVHYQGTIEMLEEDWEDIQTLDDEQTGEILLDTYVGRHNVSDAEIGDILTLEKIE